MTEEIKQCYRHEEDGVALECIKTVIRQNPGGCPRIVLLTQENCVGCQEEKARYQKDIEEGIITPIEIDSPEGAEIARKNEIYAVPAVLVLDCQNQAIE
jgi:hypothetical protein